MAVAIYLLPMEQLPIFLLFSRGIIIVTACSESRVGYLPKLSGCSRIVLQFLSVDFRLYFPMYKLISRVDISIIIEGFFYWRFVLF